MNTSSVCVVLSDTIFGATENDALRDGTPPFPLPDVISGTCEGEDILIPSSSSSSSLSSSSSSSASSLSPVIVWTSLTSLTFHCIADKLGWVSWELPPRFSLHSSTFAHGDCGLGNTSLPHTGQPFPNPDRDSPHARSCGVDVQGLFSWDIAGTRTGVREATRDSWVPEFLTQLERAPTSSLGILSSLGTDRTPSSWRRAETPGVDVTQEESSCETLEVYGACGRDSLDTDLGGLVHQTLLLAAPSSSSSSAAASWQASRAGDLYLLVYTLLLLFSLYALLLVATAFAMGNEGSALSGSESSTPLSEYNSMYSLGSRVRSSVESTRAPSPLEPPEPDLSHLTEEEVAKIRAVMDRAKAIQEEEQTRASIQPEK